MNSRSASIFLALSFCPIVLLFDALKDGGKNHAFINITHSFIIYYCVLLSALSDTFFNTLRNQPYLCCRAE